MTTTLHRALAGAFALLVAAAGLDVSGALAQALPTNDSPTTATTCGTGTRNTCGTEAIMHCEWKFEIDLNILLRSGGIKMGQNTCQKIGTRTLYKDIDTPTTLGTCETSTVGGGSRGTGSTGSRGSGDDESGDDAACYP